MKSTIESYHPAVESIKRICFNENSVGCPRYFEVVSVYLYVVCDFQNLTQLMFGNKTVIYRPYHNVRFIIRGQLQESAIMDIEDIASGYTVLGFVAVSERGIRVVL